MGLNFDRLGDQSRHDERVDHFPALAGEPEVFIILLRATNPLQLNRRYRLIDAEPAAGIEPDQLTRISRFLRAALLRQAAVPEDELRLAQKCQPRPEAHIALIATGADVRN